MRSGWPASVCAMPSSEELARGADAFVHHASAMDDRPTPRRVQMRRSAGWRKPAGVVYVGRPTQWGNPYRVGGRAHGALDPATAVAHYRDALLKGELLARDGTALIDQLPALRGRDLGCWCDLDKPCHADVLLELANRSSFGEEGDSRPPA